MQHRRNTSTPTGASALIYALLIAGCSNYGADDTAAAPDVNANTGDPASDGSNPEATTGNDGAMPGGSDGTTDAPSNGNATEGAPDVDRAPTTDGEPAAEGDGDTTPDGEGETTPEGEGAPEVTPEEPVVVIGDRPCDIYASGGTPCVGAYSMVRLLSAEYTGPLYQVRRGAPNPYFNTGVGGQTQDIGFTPDGFADSAAQDAFCGNQSCTVSVLYDQSPLGNDLVAALGGCYDGGVGDDGPTALQDDYESDAKRQPITVGGRKAYGLYTNEHEGYRNDEAVGTAEGTEAQGVYMVADGTHAGPACCFDFGNAARERCYGPTGIMSALFLGTAFWGRGAGNGPWMMGDFELGVWAGGDFPSFGLNALFGLPPSPPPNQAQVRNQLNPSLNTPFAFGALTTEVGNYSLRMGNAAGGSLTTAYDGPTQITWNLGGSIILGVGGDNSNWSWGTFYEGAMTAGRPLPGIEAQVYQNVRAAGYGQ